MPTPCRSAGSAPVSWSGPGAVPGARSGAGAAPGPGSGRGAGGRRRRPPPLPPLPAPVTVLDAPSGGASTVSQLIETTVPSYLSIEALVELACRSQCGKNWQAMYQLVRRQLVSMRLLPAQTAQLDPLRHMYQKMFADLFLSAHRTALPGPLTDGPLLLPAPGPAAAPPLASRYRSEFEELSVLGSGGFAVVSRCRSRVDRQEYAVKRIPFRCRSAAAAERTVREVAVFASLDHPNIVKYNTAWLETAGPEQAELEDVTGGTFSGVEGSASSGAADAEAETRSRPAEDSGSWVQFERPPSGREKMQAASKASENGGGDVGLLAETSKSTGDNPATDKSSGSSSERDTQQSASSSSEAGKPTDFSSEPATAHSNTAHSSGSSHGMSGEASATSVAAAAPAEKAVLPAGAFGRPPPPASRFWAASGGSSSSSGSASAPATPCFGSSRSADPAAAGVVSAGARSESAGPASLSVSRFRRSFSAPAGAWLTLHIQMQLCERTLKDWLQERNQSPLPAGARDRLSIVDPERCRRLLRDVLLGVHFIHQRGIIHRDLKPANIFIAFSGRALIGDFGLARPRAAAGAGAEPLTPLADHTSGVGTATYASPEQAAGADYDQATDVFSLGVVTYELFAPFGTAMERGRELQRLRGERRCAEDVAARWPPVAAAVLAMTEERAARRPCAAHLLTSPLFASPAERVLQLEAAAAHQGRLLEARAARGRQLADQLDSCRREAAVTERLLRNSCRQLRRQLGERDAEIERLRQLLRKAGIQPD